MRSLPALLTVASVVTVGLVTMRPERTAVIVAVGILALLIVVLAALHPRPGQTR